MTTDATPNTPSPWLYNRPFDLCFIFGIAALTLLCGLMLTHDSKYNLTIASLNVLLLATPHFVATYTRIGFDRSSARRYAFLIFPLPLLVVAGVATLAFSSGGWAVVSLYLYWQWWHFARQDYGIARMYLSRSMPAYQPHRLWDNYALYALPLCGLLYRSYQQPAAYLGNPIRTLPVPLEMVWLAGAVAAVLMMLQAAHWWRAYREKRLHAPYLFYVSCHYGVFLYCYLILGNLNYGWLAFNMWHNTQYLCFVWMYNNRRYKMGEIRNHTLMAEFSKGASAWVYVFMMISLATLLNLCVAASAHEASAFYRLLPWTLVIGMSVSFHHYLVDAVVWKRRRRSVYV